MKTTMRATYSNGTLTPEFALELSEGDEVTLTIESEPSRSFEERVELTKPSRRSIMEILNDGPERRLFQTAEEVKAYLSEEKASWER